jgi:hypothetical protein
MIPPIGKSQGVLSQEKVEKTQPHLFVVSIVLANSHGGKLSHLDGSVMGRHHLINAIYCANILLYNATITQLNFEK